MFQVAEDKQEQHTNAIGQTMLTADLPYTKERLAMMAIILQRIQSQTGTLIIWILETRNPDSSEC